MIPCPKYLPVVNKATVKTNQTKKVINRIIQIKLIEVYRFFIEFIKRLAVNIQII